VSKPRRPRGLLPRAAVALLALLVAPLLRQPSVVLAQETPPTPTVTLSVTATDKKGRVVRDLKREDFRVFEEGAEQKITHFSKDESPISYGLVVDNSGSLKNLLPVVVATGKAFVGDNRAGDETFIVRFAASDSIHVTQDFTPDKAALKESLDAMYVEGGQTAVIDALYLSADKLSKHERGGPPGRRALILLSDGEDRDSHYRLEDLLKLLRRSDVPVFCVGFVGMLDDEHGFIRPSRREQATALLKRLAAETGGQAYFPKNNAELQDAFNEVQLHLRERHAIGYTPAPVAGAKARRKVEVKVVEAPGRGKLQAVALPRFVGPKSEGDARRND
ncbi:MAG TPA: VWA domain-containing protein, partial [Pyrinomonadaceae bacterium]